MKSLEVLYTVLILIDKSNLDEKEKIIHIKNIQNNRDHLKSLKGKNSSEWREYATKCMIEIMDNKTQA